MLTKHIINYIDKAYKMDKLSIITLLVHVIKKNCGENREKKRNTKIR